MKLTFTEQSKGETINQTIVYIYPFYSNIDECYCIYHQYDKLKECFHAHHPRGSPMTTQHL